MATVVNKEISRTRGNADYFFPDEIQIDEATAGRAFRPDADAVYNLAMRIKAEGQISDVTVRLDSERRPVLVAGATRRDAFLLLNAGVEREQQRKVRCQIITCNPEEAFLLAISENQRNPVSSIDTAHNIRKLMRDFQKTDEEICKVYGKVVNSTLVPASPSWLSQTLKLLTLSRERQLAIHTGEISPTVGIAIADLPDSLRESIVTDASASGKLTVEKVRNSARSAGVAKTGALSASTMRKAWQYVSEQHKESKLGRLAKLQLQWQAGGLAEPDFFRELRSIFVN